MKSQPGFTFTPAIRFAGAAAGMSISAVMAASAAASPFAIGRSYPEPGSSLGSDGPGSSRPRLSLASVHPAARLGGGAPGDRRARRGHRPDRRRGQPLHRRRVVAVVQRARPRAPAHRRGRARPARQGRPLDHARPEPQAGDRAGAAARRARAARPHARLLLGLRLHGHRDRAQDGVPVLAPARPGPAPLRGAQDGLPRRHDRLRVGGRHRPLPLDVRAAPVRHAQGRAGRRRGHGAAARPSTRARWRR